MRSPARRPRPSRRSLVPMLAMALLLVPAIEAQAPAPSPAPDTRSQRLEAGERLQDCVLPLHTAADDMGVPYGIWAAGARYKASFHDAATFVPLLGAGYPHNLPVTWRTTSVRIGATELVTQSPRLDHDDLRARYELGGVTEHWEVRLDGLEQTFVIAQRPAAEGDLVIRGTVATALHCDDIAAAHQSLRWLDDQGREIAVYGAATAIDALGNRRPMTTSHAGGVVTLRLDGAWLATAAFPLVVDPLLGPGQSVTGAARSEVDIVREDENYGDAVWIAYTTLASATDQDLYVRRWNPDGSLSSQAYTDITTSWSTSDPHLTYVAMVDHVVVTFDRLLPTQRRYVRWHRHARADLTANTTFESVGATGDAWRSDVSGVRYSSSNAPQALLVWQQEPNNSGPFQNTTGSDIYGCYLDVLAGTTGTPFAIANSVLLDHERPSLCRTAIGALSGWAIVYQTYTSLSTTDDWDVAMRLIDLTFGITAPMAIDDASPDHKMAPIVEGQNPDFLVGFTTSTLAQQPGKPEGFAGHQIRVTPVHWTYLDATGTQPHGTVLMQSNLDPRLEIAGLGFDYDTDSHWSLMFRSNTSEILYARTVGFTGQTLWADTVLNPAGSDVSVRGGVSYDADADRFLLAYGVNGTSNYVTFDRLTYPAVTPWSASGPSCSTASISWYGTQLIGSRDSRVVVTNAPLSSLHVLAMATAPASVQLFGIPPFVDGCWLLIPSTGPDFLGIVDVGFGHIPVWNFVLPEFLVSYTYYFQDFHTDGSANFRLVSTQRLAVPLVR